MQHLVLELDDRAVATATGGRVLSSAPAAVFDGTAGTTVGANAWRELRIHPRAISTRHLSSVLTQRGTSARAEEVLEAGLKTRLAGLQIAEGQRMWIVAPAHAEAAGLTALLGITRRMDLPVDGFVDAATATTAGLASKQSTIVLELGLHHAAATSVECSASQARRRQAVQTDRGGLIELYQVWLDLVSTTMVKRTRFDPLYDAATEQHVFDSIPALAMEAGRTGSTTASATRGADRFEVTLTRDQFAQVAQPIYRAMVGLLHQLRPAGVPVTIVMPQLAAQLPGLREQLEQFVGCELISIPDGFAASSTSLLDLPAPPESEGAAVSLLRRLPLSRYGVVIQEAVEVDMRTGAQTTYAPMAGFAGEMQADDAPTAGFAEEVQADATAAAGAHEVSGGGNTTVPSRYDSAEAGNADSTISDDVTGGNPTEADPTGADPTDVNRTGANRAGANRTEASPAGASTTASVDAGPAASGEGGPIASGGEVSPTATGEAHQESRPAPDQHNVDSIPQAVAVTRAPLGQRRITGPAPSHVLWEGRAYPLHPDNLVVGRERTNNPRYITLQDGLAGVSRRHCTFVHDGDELVLLDHSTFGTFVNGERVQERVRIYAGDRVRLGEPGVELTLIAVGPQQP